MSLRNFEGETFVAFTDISGFKQLMKQSKAMNALDCLYTIGYEELQNPWDVCGMFISDSGILYTDRGDKLLQLEHLLDIIKQINNRMLEKGYMLTTSIAYGDFSYCERIEFKGIQKNPLYGNAYVNAYIDNDKGLPKIQPGQCRIKKKYIDDCLNRNFRFFKHLRSKNDYYYFYWNVNDYNKIEEFEELYNDSYNLKYKGMEEALKAFRN